MKKGNIIIGVVSLVLVGATAFFIIKGLKTAKKIKDKKASSDKKGKVGTTQSQVDIDVEDGRAGEVVAEVKTTSEGTSIKANENLGLGEVVVKVPSASNQISTELPEGSRVGTYVVKNTLSFKKGNYSEYIKLVQSKLGLTPDGKYGNNTYNAVLTFQRNNKLIADGIVGKNTWKALFGQDFPNS